MRQKVRGGRLHSVMTTLRRIERHLMQFAHKPECLFGTLSKGEKVIGLSARY
jgi:hypothetical protein